MFSERNIPLFLPLESLESSPQSNLILQFKSVSLRQWFSTCAFQPLGGPRILLQGLPKAARKHCVLITHTPHALHPGTSNTTPCPLHPLSHRIQSEPPLEPSCVGLGQVTTTAVNL